MQISAFIQNPIENSDSAVTNIGIRTQLPKHTKILAKILLRNPYTIGGIFLFHERNC